MGMVRRIGYRPARIDLGNRPILVGYDLKHDDWAHRQVVPRALAQPTEPATEDNEMVSVRRLGTPHPSLEQKELLGSVHQLPSGPLWQLDQELLELYAGAQAGVDEPLVEQAAELLLRWAASGLVGRYFTGSPQKAIAPG